MKSISRHKLNKSRSSRAFSRDVRTVASINMRNAPMRGGHRL